MFCKRERGPPHTAWVRMRRCEGRWLPLSPYRPAETPGAGEMLVGEARVRIRRSKVEDVEEIRFYRLGHGGGGPGGVVTEGNVARAEALFRARRPATAVAVRPWRPGEVLERAFLERAVDLVVRRLAGEHPDGVLLI